MQMSLCDANRAVSDEVKDFILHVREVKEESITDYLALQWRKLDARFNYLSMTQFTRLEESNTTGSDFDLELWLVHRKWHLSFAIQAKKFTKPYDSYVKKLQYPDGTKSQISTLLSYATTNNKIPAYIIYSIPDSETEFLCCRKQHDGGIFLASAYEMERFANLGPRSRVSLNAILARSNPYYCLFCCPLGATPKYLDTYYRPPSGDSLAGDSPYRRSNEELPSYVYRLLERNDAGVTDTPDLRPERNEGWEKFKVVGVYDLRRQEFGLFDV